ncbi:MAG: hypothetical protein GY723_08840 [bacterium]|nr:hypothetical protein [bacterium]
MRFAPARALAVLFCTVVPSRAEDVETKEQGHLATALAEASANRAELERVLAHVRASGDVQKVQAAEFLISNMSGKGYVVTELRTKEGKTIPYDPIGFTNLEEAQVELERIEKEHGAAEFARDRLVRDLKTVTAAFLIRHIDEAFLAWRGVPEDKRVGLEAFLHYVLPYRGSQEPVDDWLPVLRRRYAPRARALADGKIDLDELYKWVLKDIGKRVKFNSRYYLHPTDQSFTEMGRSGMGRCEDITNMQTYGARSLAIASAADYTPAWARGNNNHAWNVLLDKDGLGAQPRFGHAAKIYRKTYAIQRGNLAFLLPKGREAPNRFLKSTSYIDVTDQYGDCYDVTVELDPTIVGDEKFGYLCVFNSGRWTAIHWGRIEGGKATFDRMGGNICHLPAIHDGKKLIPAADPIIIHKDGSRERLRGKAEGVSGLLTASSGKHKNVDTNVETPISHLKEGKTYEFFRWDDGWKLIDTFVATKVPHAFEGLSNDGLYWLSEKGFRKLERVFTLQGGRQLWW